MERSAEYDVTHRICYRQTDVGVTEDGPTRRALLRCSSLGVVFFWFGVLKFFPAFSPAADLAARAITTLSFRLVAPGLLLPRLAALGVLLIGRSMLSGPCMRATIYPSSCLQMVGHTLTPLLLFPTVILHHFPAGTDTGRSVHHQNSRRPRSAPRWSIHSQVRVVGSLPIQSMVRELDTHRRTPARVVGACRLHRLPARRRADAATRCACRTSVTA